MAQVIPFLRSRDFFSTLFSSIRPSIAEADATVANGPKKVLTKKTSTFINGPTNLPKSSPRNLPG